jgi:peptide/nickel transport system substrate-binding protein
MEPANNVGYLGFNQAHAPWGNRDCRLAVAHAIDKQGIVDSLYAGDAEPAKEMMPPGLWGYNEAVEDYAFDMAEAQGALDRCLAAETMPAEVLFYVPPIQRFYYPKPKELGEAIQASLSELGINTSIQSPDWGSVYLPDVRNGEADIWLLGWGGDNGDPDNFLCVFFCGGSADFNADAEGNPLPPSEAVNEVLRRAATLNDQAERQALYEEANQLIHDEVLAVPLVHRSPPLFFRADVAGYTSSPLQTILTGVSKG